MDYGFILLIILSLAPVAVLLWYFDSKDKNKESRKFLWSIFLWGVFITLIAGVIEYFLDTYLTGIFVTPMLQLIVVAFVFTAVTEESLKYWVVKKKVYEHPAFNEYYDGVIYAVVASLGFAALENIFYVLDGGIYVAVIRAILAVPAHALFGAIMGYYIGLARFEKNKQISKELLTKGLWLAIFFHGIYDFLLLSGTVFAVLVIPLILALYLNIRRKIKKLHYLDKIDGVEKPDKWTLKNYTKAVIGLIFFTIGTIIIFMTTLFLTDPSVAEEVFAEAQVTFEPTGNFIFAAVMWVIAWALIKEKKVKT